MNGACSHLIKKGEEVIIMGYELADKPFEPKSVLASKDNKVERFL
ncbi:MAG: aspartate 1-decarboxylase [Chitinivibrionia bacterium]|nr:aspartate 1-decarboxylase [Chitinivibrionia bacterium]